MKDLIKVNYDIDRQTTSARDLWEFLGRPHGEFMKWFSRYAEYGFTVDIDYQVIDRLVENCSALGGRPPTDYEITIEMAKELAMLQKTEKGKQARQYFIELEKRWNSPDALMARAIKMADIKIIQLKNIVGELKPKADSFDDFMNASGNLSMNEAAKTLNYDGVGPKKIFKVLKLLGILYKKGSIWLPKQEHITSKRFVVKQHPVKKGPVVEQYTQVFVTPKGLDWLNKTLADNGYKKLSNDPVLV